MPRHRVAAPHHSTTFSLRWQPWQLQFVELAAEEAGVTVSDFIRRATLEVACRRLRGSDPMPAPADEQVS
ncbi:MAG: hypothetical protein JWM95_2420 [Gemmatimonadetes bacterium]|nr:hypothetical protein [Gemmatimonadota bacterium]